jgi:hypothetical protein
MNDPQPLEELNPTDVERLVNIKSAQECAGALANELIEPLLQPRVQAPL